MGLPTALLLARAGNNVHGYDIDKRKIDCLQNNTLPFEENGLQALYDEAKHHFFPSTILEPSDVYIITVPTPITSEKICDISSVVSAVNAIKKVLRDGDLVILESTVALGTTMHTVKPLLDETGKTYLLSYVSEKAIPGKTIYEMQHNHRIIGGIDEQSAQRTKELYACFVKSTIHVTDCTTAEAVKLIENTYRDVNIALANELARRLSSQHVNVWEAIRLANHHPRVHLHNPGPGVGGHCIAIDPWFLVNPYTSLITQARKINDSMPFFVVEMVEHLLGQCFGSTIVLLGVSYKGNVDDDRESPTYSIKHILETRGMRVLLYDPLIKNNPNVSSQLEDVTCHADCLVLVTDHDLFKHLDPWTIHNMKRKMLIDTRNILDHAQWRAAGFTVIVLGT
jgi:UDP-N-acetyl-D-mannosaminuronic acid dehydrogenase